MQRTVLVVLLVDNCSLSLPCVPTFVPEGVRIECNMCVHILLGGEYNMSTDHCSVIVNDLNLLLKKKRKNREGFFGWVRETGCGRRDSNARRWVCRRGGGRGVEARALKRALDRMILISSSVGSG